MGSKRERPILFSAPMVRAILEGRKTQTRRLVKEPRVATLYGRHSVTERHFADPGFGDGIYLHWVYTGGDMGDDTPSTRVFCPYGVPGDRLWVKETHALRVDCEPGSEKAKHYALYRASYDSDFASEWHNYGGRWRPSIHMPRWASRITLEVTGVRVERLQAISEEDAKAEGVDVYGATMLGDPDEGHEARAKFAWLWNAINGTKAPWSSNPWVWVVSFRRLENQDA